MESPPFGRLKGGGAGAGGEVQYDEVQRFFLRRFQQKQEKLAKNWVLDPRELESTCLCHYYLLSHHLTAVSPPPRNHA